MKYLYIFLEGDDDERYFKSIIAPLLKRKYDKIIFYTYRNKSKEKVMGFIKSINSVSSSDYIFIADIDLFKNEDLKKRNLIDIYGNLDVKKVFIVIKEIEAWYLAGLDNDYILKHNISVKNDTNNIVKESFENILKNSKNKKMTPSTWMIEILKNDNLNVAIEKNNSLKNFINIIT